MELGHVTTTYAHDSRNRLIRKTYPDGGYIAYDAAGNRTRVSTPTGDTTYGFDALNRLASVTDRDGGTTTYSYDAKNRLILVHAGACSRRVCSAVAATYYCHGDCLVSVSGNFTFRAAMIYC